MIDRASWGHSYLTVRHKILGFVKNGLLRKHLPRVFIDQEGRLDGAHQKCSSSGGAWCDSADKCFLEPWMVRANLSKPCPTSKQEDVRQKCSVARQVLVLPCYSSFDVICHDVKALGWSQCFSLCMLQLAPFDSNFRWLARACSSPWWFSFFYSLRKTLEDRRQIE